MVEKGETNSCSPLSCSITLGLTRVMYLILHLLFVVQLDFWTTGLQTVRSVVHQVTKKL